MNGLLQVAGAGKRRPGSGTAERKPYMISRIRNPAIAPGLRTVDRPGRTCDAGVTTNRPGDRLDRHRTTAAAIRVLMMPRDTNHHGTIFGGVILATSTRPAPWPRCAWAAAGS